MNPNDSALLMRDTSADKADRLKAACSLVGWLSAGGELPDGSEGRFASAEECRSYIRRLG